MEDSKQWVEDCYSNFQEALGDSNYNAAKACIADMFDVNADYARMMSRELREAHKDPHDVC